MEIENQSTFISQMLQDIQAGVVDKETTISFKEDMPKLCLLHITENASTPCGCLSCIPERLQKRETL